MRSRARRRRRRLGALPLAALAVAALALLALAVGLGFAGSPRTLAAGVRVDGVDVGGRSPAEAERLLARRAAAVARVPVAFVAGGRRFAVTPDELGLRVDWAAAVAAARRRGDGIGPLRGFRRLDLRIAGADVVPHARLYSGALALELRRIAGAVDRPRREPALRLAGLQPLLVPGRAGTVLDRRVAAARIVSALTSLERGRAVTLPLRVDAPHVAAAALAPAAARVRRLLSGPVRLTLGPTRWRLSPARLAQLLQLPADGRTTVQVGGPAATAWVAALGRRIHHPAQDATFAVNGSSVTIVPGRPGYAVDAQATAAALLAAGSRRLNRVAPVAVVATQPKRTTAAARAMGITGLVSSYTTDFGGIANRIHNVQLVAHLIDGALVAPGATFSFNETTGARTADKGFLEAPVIINGEVQTGLGGGVCQVSTTVFNAAFEAGLKITQRTNHALYISHYPQGRDATVDYPDVDLKFVNDTDHWLLLRTFVSSSQLTVNLYGTPQHRRVVSTTSPLVEIAKPPVKKTVDPTLKPGETVVDDSGEPAFTTSVHRVVYDPNGTVLHDDTWYSHYVSSPELVRVGPKKAKKKAKPGAATKPAATTPAATSTAPATTTPPTTTG